MSDASRGVQRLIVAALILFLVLVLLLPLALFSYGQVFRYSVGPSEVAASFTLERRDGIAYSFFNRVLLFSDTTSYEFTHTGYRSEALEFVRDSEQRAFHIELAPLPGYLDIVLSDEFPVTVKVDGQEQNVLSSIELARGNHIVTLLRGNSELVSESIEIQGFGASQQLEFDLAKHQAFLRISTQPTSAMIELNGTVIGTGNFEGGIVTGQSRLAVKRQGYESQIFDFTPNMSDTIDLGTVTLTPSPVSLSVSTIPSNASLLLDGKFVGESDTTFEVQPLKAFELVVRKPGYHEHRMVLKPEIGQNLSRTINFEQETVRFSIQIRPHGTIVVNGISQGNAPQTLDVYPGDVVEARSDGLSTQAFTVDSAHSADQSRSFELFAPADHAYRFAPEKQKVSGNLELIRFPPLRFRRSVDSETKQVADIELNRPFYLGATEVTIEAYNLYRASTTAAASKRPVINVSWVDAAKFCNWLSTKHDLTPFYVISAYNVLDAIDISSLGFRLPTEAEWEAGASFDWRSNRVFEPYEWGSTSTIPIAFGNLAGGEVSKTRARYLAEFLDNHVRGAPVASYRPNFNGLHDMTGNVAEWVHDYYEIVRETDTGPDYLGPKIGFTHVVKGSSYETDDLSEVATHFRRFEIGKKETVGFRVARWIY